jgi:ABC-type lipoprotein export system ATPase subunit
VLENLTLAPIRVSGVPEDQAKGEAMIQLERVKIAEQAEKYPGQLSGGQQQRVAIARALVHRPALVLADEPTGNLDQETSRQVIELMTHVLAREGTTLIMATHSEEAADSAHEVFRLTGGRLERRA